jgi:NADPH:quinone reductase-like Zn-dependent oxidoreductase
MAKTAAPIESTSVAVETMTAILQDRYDTSPEDVLRLAQVDRPIVGGHEVLVRVRAASVGRETVHVMTGLPYPIRVAGFGLRAPKYLNPGQSLAGTVETIGPDVTGFLLGDDVFGIGKGAFAEYALVQQDRLAPKPGNLSYEEAAAVPISALTALQAVRDHAKVGVGEKVLIVGASGGVGTFALQIAKTYGAEVTGVASTAKQDMVRDIGADHVVDYARQDFADGEHRYDVIIDTGGNRRLSDLRRALTPKGRLIIAGGETEGRWLGGSDRQIRAQVLSLFVSQKLGTFISSENAADLVVLGKLIEAGDVRPILDSTRPLSDAAAAIRHLMDGHARGKIVIKI